jgi:hypothetical protein
MRNKKSGSIFTDPQSQNLISEMADFILSRITVKELRSEFRHITYSLYEYHVKNNERGIADNGSAMFFLNQFEENIISQLKESAIGEEKQLLIDGLAEFLEFRGGDAVKDVNEILRAHAWYEEKNGDAIDEFAVQQLHVLSFFVEFGAYLQKFHLHWNSIQEAKNKFEQEIAVC